MNQINDVAQRSSKLSLTSSTAEPLVEYKLQKLEPRPTDAWQHDDVSFSSNVSRHRTSDAMHEEHSLKSSSVRRDSSIGSLSKRKSKSLFAGPPPPIAASILATKQPSGVSPNGHESDIKSHGPFRMMGRSIGHFMFDQSRSEYGSHHRRPDALWRNLRRRERNLEDDIQQLLDFQAAGLVSGSQVDETSSSGNHDNYSDAGDSTPAGTFFPTATSRSQVPKSLYLTPRSTTDGNVIPVRQPARTRPPGLRTIRNGLRTAIESLKELRREECEHIATAIRERKLALQELHNLGTRRLAIQSELTASDNDGEEPLARELRELGQRHIFVDQEIGRLEEQLTGLRKQRRWLQDQMSHVRGQREANLSGYRGALRDVDSELSNLMRRPPVLPLDPAIHGEGDETLRRDLASAGGPEFLSLTPERRSPEMAKSWWEAELAVLEKRAIHVNEDLRALEGGSALWKDVLALVSNFESDLRRAMRGGAPSQLDSSSKGKEKADTEEDLIRNQAASMGNILRQLEQAMEVAESNRWNLLICAIGAELEAFKEAHDVLTTLLPQEDEITSNPSNIPPNSGQSALANHAFVHVDESDDDVPPDLLESHADDGRQHSTNIATAVNFAEAEDTGYKRPLSQGSGNEVPLEFLAEHG